MAFKWKHLLVTFVLDVLILALLVFYKFNFIFPDDNQFIFSGDFIRPISPESLIKYYIYPFLLNEHGMFVDPTFIVKIPYWSLLTLVSFIVPLNVCYWLFIVVTQILSGLLISTSSRTLFSSEKKYSYYIIPLIPAIFAIFSYPINYRPYWLFLPLLPGLLQCVLIILYKTFTNHKLDVWTKLLLVLIGYLAILQVHNIIFILITLTFSFFVIMLLEKERIAIIKDYSSITFWLSLPLLLSMIPTLMITFSSGQLLSPSYVYTYTVLEFTSSSANFVNAFTFSIGFWEKVAYTYLDKLIALLIVSFVVMSYSLIKKKFFLLSIFLIFVISLSFQLGIHNPIYKLLADPANQFAWVLRDPFKISLVSLGLFTTIFAFTIKHFSINATLKGRTLVTSFIVILVILLVVEWSPATKTSEIIQPSTIPKEYFTAIDYLNENTEGPLLFLPIDGKGYTWADNLNLQGSFLARSYQGNYIDYTATRKELKELLIYATSTKNLQVLSLVTSGIVMDTSMEGRDTCFDKMARYILSNRTEDTVKLGVYLYFLPNEEYSCFRIIGYPFYLMTPTDYTYTGSFSQFSNMDQGMVFFDSFEWLLRNAEEIKLSSKVAKPSIAWSLGYTHDPLHGPWHSYLEERGIENWDFDYGKGLVFTWASSRLKEHSAPNNNDLVDEWTFDSMNDLNQWKNYTHENQFGAVYTLTLEKNSLKAELYNSTCGWKTIKSPLIPVERSNWYRWQVRIKGENTYKTHVKIVEYNEPGNIITAKIVKSIGSGTFNWETITIDYTPQHTETKYIQLQIWHGHNTTQPLPNIIWIDNVKVYDMKRFVEPVKLEIPFKVDTTDEYAFFIRYFKNQEGGEIKIQLDNKIYTINTKDQLNKFVWNETDWIHLKKGSHRIILTNVRGFNAVNLFALIPRQELVKAQNKVERLLSNKTIIYIFEGENDIYRENAEINKDRNASNGEKLVFLSRGKAWRDFEVIRKGFYRFALRVEGQFEIKIDNQTFLVSPNNLNFTYLKPIYFDKGLHRIEIKTKPIIQSSWNFNEEDDISEWKGYTQERQTPYIYKVLYDEEENALRVELYNSTWGWKTIKSPLVPVKYGEKYEFKFSVKAVNGERVHFKIIEYNSSKQYVTGTYAGSIGSGTFDWKTINYQYEPKNASTTYIQLQIWHGHETEQPLPNIVWIKNVTIEKCEDRYLDVVWIYSVSSSETNSTIEDLFKVNETPAEIINYKKINPTLWKVKINATKPFMLSFAESYDPMWEARVYKNGEKIETAKPVPLYGVINGFWINQTGNLTIEIRYTPQDWFETGLWISGATFIGCTAYLTYDWRKNTKTKRKKPHKKHRNKKTIKNRKTRKIERKIDKTFQKKTGKKK